MRSFTFALLVILLVSGSLCCHWRYAEVSYTTNCGTSGTNCNLDITLTVGVGDCAITSETPTSGTCGYQDFNQKLDDIDIYITDSGGGFVESLEFGANVHPWCEVLPRPQPDGSGDNWRRYQLTRSTTIPSCGAGDWYKLSGSENAREHCIPNDPGSWNAISNESGYPTGGLDNCGGTAGSIQFESVVDYCTCHDSAWMGLTQTTWKSPVPQIANLVYFPSSTTNYFEFPILNESPGAVTQSVSCALDTDTQQSTGLTAGSTTSFASDIEWLPVQCPFPYDTNSAAPLSVSDPVECGITWDSSACVTGQKFILRVKAANSEPAFTCSGASRSYTLFDTLVEVVDGVEPVCSGNTAEVVICDTLGSCPSVSGAGGAVFSNSIEKPSYTGQFLQFFWSDLTWAPTSPTTGTVSWSQSGDGFTILSSSIQDYKNCASEDCADDADGYPMDITTEVFNPSQAGTWTSSVTYCDLYNLCGSCDLEVTFKVKPSIQIMVYQETAMVGTFESGEPGVEAVDISVTTDAPASLSCTTLASGLCELTGLTDGDTVTAISVDIGGAQYQAATNQADANGDFTNPPVPYVMAYDVHPIFYVGLISTEISVAGRMTSGVSYTDITNGDTMPQTGDGTDFSVISVSSPSGNSRVFQITNTGLGTLTITSVVSSTSEFVVSSVPTSVGPNSAEEFTVTVTPTVLGVVTGTITIENDETNPGGIDERTFTFGVSATGIDPRIAVSGNSMAIADDDPASTTAQTDLGAVDTRGGTQVISVVVQNPGHTTALDLSMASVTGDSEFSCMTCGAASITAATPGPGTSYTIEVLVTPVQGATGVKTAVLSIPHNDPTDADGQFLVNLQFTAVEPSVVVSGNGMLIADGDPSPDAADDTLADDTFVYGTFGSTFTITNGGALDLTISSITVSDTTNWSVTGPVSSTVSGGGGTTTFVVTFQPQSIGTFPATVTVNSDAGAPGTNVYTFAVTGTGLDGLISVTGMSMTISSGDDTPSNADNTLFAPTLVGGTLTHMFEIENAGNAELIVNSITGGNAHWTIGSVPASVAAGGTEMFTVRFNPTTIINSTITVTVNTDTRTGTQPYIFDVRSLGLDGRLVVEGNGIVVVDGDTVADFADLTQFPGAPATAVLHTFDIRNDGNYELVISSMTLTDVSGGGSGAAEFVLANTMVTLAPGESTTFDLLFDPDPDVNGYLLAQVNLATDQRSAGANFLNPTTYEFRVGVFLPPAEFTVWPLADCYMYNLCCFNWTHNIPVNHEVDFAVLDADFPTAAGRMAALRIPIGLSGGTYCFVAHHLYTSRHQIQAHTWVGAYDDRLWPESVSFSIVVKPPRPQD